MHCPLMVTATKASPEHEKTDTPEHGEFWRGFPQTTSGQQRRHLIGKHVGLTPLTGVCIRCGGVEHTIVPTEMRPSCVRMNTTRKRVTAEICCVTAKVFMT